MINVVVIDDDPLVRAAIRLLLGASDDIDVVGEAGDGEQASAVIDELDPDVVLMDIRMPGDDGVTTTARLRRRGPRPAVLVLTTFETDELVRRALAAGADGYLLKDVPPEVLMASVRKVAQGERTVSATVLGRLIDMVVDEQRPTDRARARAALASLGAQELRVVSAVAEGKSNAEIARELYLSTSTVKGYLTRIMARLGCENRVQVALLVQEAKLPSDTVPPG
ncbi:response regulator transcription factor [Austwickia chelonae]|uniref:response regulator transcription factor n=1 Tax=Austwickia chelonae TaxID=100225 RepID=UPI001F079B3D|nr:response regulator transcription factor [Austwickia chelonae]